MNHRSKGLFHGFSNLVYSFIFLSFVFIYFFFHPYLTFATQIKDTHKSYPGRFIVKLKKTKNTSDSLLRLSKEFKLSSIGKQNNFYQLEVKNKSNVGAEASAEILKKLRKNPEVEYAQLDHVITLRSITPNDPKYSEQWGLNGIGSVTSSKANEVWNYSTGGENKLGQEIVVAVLDSGVDLDHEDLIDNIWTNSGEIPNNGIDDDQNGYVDDIHGINTYTNKDDGSVGDHATHVAGIIGARGDNGLGVSGVNHNVKIVSVKVFGGYDSNSLTTRAIAGYQYVISLKKLWLQSGGTKGANIVATNSSFGVDLAKCDSEEYPVWNELYNEMGSLGIISVAATANRDVNVDISGDIPTSCTSDFLVTVTNQNSKNQKHMQAGFGRLSIDLAAPGTDVLSTVPNNGYGVKSGTSMSTPHVAGAIALLHSVASIRFSENYFSNPAEGALILKDTLLKATEKASHWGEFTLSGGSLDILTATNLISGY